MWIPNGVDLRLAPPPAPPPAGRPFTVAYAGAHAMANDLDSVLDCAALLQQDRPEHPVLFRMIGDGAEKQRLIRRAQQMGLENVRFEDPVSKDRVYSFLAQADAFIITLRDSPLYAYGISPNKLWLEELNREFGICRREADFWRYPPLGSNSPLFRVGEPNAASG